MSLCKTKVCGQILREHFGEVAEKVGDCLLRKGSSALRHIVDTTSLDMDKVKKVLTILIQQNLVNFTKNKRGFMEYCIDTDMVLWRLRIPRYIFCAKGLYGDGAELVIEELLHHGQLLMSDVVNSVTDKLNEAMENAGHGKISPSVVYDKFCSLTHTHFIQQCTNPMEDTVEDEQDERELSKLYKVPPWNNKENERKRKRSEEESSQPKKRQKTGDGESVDKAWDDGVYWKVHHVRFQQHFRDQVFIKAMCSKIDQEFEEFEECFKYGSTLPNDGLMNAGNILQTMLRISEVKTDNLAFTTNPMSFNEIYQNVPRDLGMTRNTCEQYLNIMVDDSMGFVNKVGDSGGGMYIVNIMKALKSLCEAHIESVIQERFGSKSLRIFRVLLLKQHLEQKQIEEMAMIPSKEAKELLYTMFAQNFITVTEISKTPDHAPARTFFLFRVNIEQLARRLLENSYKALSNAMLKREAETRDNRRLMEKQERVDAILLSLEQSGSDEIQKEEIVQTITPAEKSQLTKVKHKINMLEQSELQLDETIFVLETFLFYHDMKKKLKL